MEENGVGMRGKWVKNGTRSGNFCIFPGPIFPISPKAYQFPSRAANKKVGIQVPGGKNGEISRYPQVFRKLHTS